MSRTSSETAGRPSFARVFVVSVVVLALLCAGLIALAVVQGPRLQGGQLGGQQLRLFVNQAVAQVDAGQVTVDPETPVSVETAGDVITVLFDRPLDYDADYRVTVAGVTSSSLARPATLEYAFTTASPSFFWLDRGEPVDAILRSSLDAAGGERVFEATGIQDFALLDGILAVATAEGRASRLDLVSLTDGAVERLRLPEGVVLQRLGTAGSRLVFTLADAQAGPGAGLETLYTIDLQQSREPVAVLGIDGEPVTALAWEPIPGTGDLLALDTDRTLLRVGAAGPVPLGRFQDLISVGVGGTTAVVDDAGGRLLLSLADGATEPMSVSPVDGAEVPAGDIRVLPDGTTVAKALLVADGGARFSPVMVHDDGTESRIVYRTVEDRGSIGEFQLSPNGQLVVAEVVPDNALAESDGSIVDPRATSVTTVLVDARTGAPVRSLDGFGLVWAAP